MDMDMRIILIIAVLSIIAMSWNSSQETMSGNLTKAKSVVLDLAENVTVVQDNIVKDNIGETYDSLSVESGPNSCSEANANFIDIQAEVFEDISNTGKLTKTYYGKLSDANEEVLQRCQAYPSVIKGAEENRKIFQLQIFRR